MIIIFCIFGIIAGIIAGLLPGLHSNNLAVMLSVSPIFGTEATAFILCMCTAQIFTEFIPAVFIGAPSDNTFEAILPAHKMLLEGKAYEAICLTTIGAIIAVIIGAVLTPAFFLFLEANSAQIITATPIVLIFALIIFVTNERGWKKRTLVVFVIIAAATQGFYFKEQLFPLITGYFGTAGILYSLKDKILTVKQTSTVEIDFTAVKEALVGVIGGAIVAVMPGIGSNTAGGIINAFRKNTLGKNYLSMLGAINASNFFFSFATLFALSKARNGGMLALSEKILLTNDTLFIGTILMVASAGVSGILAILIAKKALKIFNEKIIKITTTFALILMILLVFAFNGIFGIITLVFSTALGLFVLTQKVKRSTCMSALIVPVLFFYVFILI